MMEDIKNAFDSIAAEYDSQRQYVIPQMDQYYSGGLGRGIGREQPNDSRHRCRDGSFECTHAR
jgi:hypothetical protein